MTSEATPSKEINETEINKNKPPRFEQDGQEKPHDVGMKNKSSSIRERTTQLLVKPQQSSIPFPNRVRKEKEEAHQRIFLENLKQLHINILFIEALVKMPKYAKYLRSLLMNKSRLEEACTVTMMKGLGELKPTRMSLKLADGSIQYRRGIVKNVLIKVDKFIFPIDFVILDMPEDSRSLIILGRPFLATARAMIDVFNKKITLRVGDDEVNFDMDQSIKKPPTKDDECHGIDDLDDIINIETQELLENDQLDPFLLKGLEKSINQSDLEGCNFVGDEFDNNSNVDLSIRRIDPVNTPYSEAQETEGTDRPSHLEYAYLHGNKSFPIIIPSKRSEEEKFSLLQVLEKCKGGEDLAANHLSRLENPHMEILTEREIADEFPDKHLMLLKSKFNDDEPFKLLLSLRPLKNLLEDGQGLDDVFWILSTLVLESWILRIRREGIAGECYALAYLL
ncbi:DNA-directed DNA polymerase [Tanacetum coccineum]